MEFVKEFLQESNTLQISLDNKSSLKEIYQFINQKVPLFTQQNQSPKHKLQEDLQLDTEILRSILISYALLVPFGLVKKY
jgi:DNA topoisomerase VI subunit A